MTGDTLAPRAEVRASPYEPRLFEHDVDPALFTGQRLDELVREAHRRRRLWVQWADPGRQRFGNEPVYTYPRYPVLEDALERPVQYRIFGVAEWGGREYSETQERVLEQHLPALPEPPVAVDDVVRVFSPHAVVAIHGDPDLKLVCDVSGRTVWYCRPPEEMTNEEHENLLRGGFFLRWRESDREVALPIDPGTGCFVPSRWAHWLDHPCEEPVTSFELGFWTVESTRARKLYDVNWLLRRAGASPSPPGRGTREAAKLRLFDAVSLLTRKGARYRGV